AQIFSGRHGIGELRPGIQILKIEADYNLAFDALVKINQVADHAIFVHLPADGNFENIIMPMPVRVVALAVSGAVLFFGYLLAMQAMRCREAIAAGEVGLWHLVIW